MDYHLSSFALTMLGVLAIWDLVWKGFALWRAAQRKQTPWFVAILVINSAGILPIAYLLLQTDSARSKKDGKNKNE